MSCNSIIFNYINFLQLQLFKINVFIKFIIFQKMQSTTVVKINLYDLSQGMARSMSQGFLGKQIDGIWHTGVLVFSYEYYFGGGICQGPPGMTPYGNPYKTIKIATTAKKKWEFEKYLSTISNKFCMQTYDLLTNNCNNFADECVFWLTGKRIPSYITGLPQECLNTPLGQMMKPMIQNMQNMVQQQGQGQAMNLPGMLEGGNNQQSMFGGQQQQQRGYQPQQRRGPQYKLSYVSELKGFMEYVEALEQTENQGGMILAFISKWDQRWPAIMKKYQELSVAFQKKTQRLKFFTVDIDSNEDLVGQFELKDTPTFVTICNGEQFIRMEGANQLKQSANQFSEIGKKLYQSLKALQAKQTKTISNKAYSLINKIVTNLAKNYDPNNVDSKFSRVKSTNKTLQAKLFLFPNAVQLLMLVGFLPDEKKELYTNKLNLSELTKMKDELQNAYNITQSEPKQLSRNELKILFPQWIKQRLKGCQRKKCYNKNCANFPGSKKMAKDAITQEVMAKLKSRQKIQLCTGVNSIELYGDSELEQISKQVEDDVRKILNALYGKMVMSNQ